MMIDLKTCLYDFRLRHIVFKSKIMKTQMPKIETQKDINT